MDVINVVYWSSLYDLSYGYFLGCAVLTFGGATAFLCLFSLLNDSLADDQLGTGSGFQAFNGLMGVLFGFWFIVNFVEDGDDGCKPFYMLVSMAPILLLLPYYFVNEAQLLEVPQGEHSIWDKSKRMLTDPEERDFAKTLVMQICKMSEDANTSFKMFNVRDMMRVTDFVMYIFHLMAESFEFFRIRTFKFEF